MTFKRILVVIVLWGFFGSIVFSAALAQESGITTPTVSLSGQVEVHGAGLPQGDEHNPLPFSDDGTIRIAQMDRHDQEGREPGERGHGKNPKLMIMWNLVDYLNLDEQTAADFFPLFNDYSQKREKLIETHRALVEQIIDNVEKDSYSISDLKNLVQKLDDADESLHKERNAFLTKAKKILDDRQYIKLVIFDEKLKKDLFNRFSSRRMSMNKPEDSDMRNPDSGRQNLSIQNVDKKNLEELQKMIEQQRKEIERQQKQIEQLLKEK